MITTEICQERFDLLKSLEPGWYDGVGTKYDPAFVDTVAAAFFASIPPGADLPGIFPTDGGTIFFEWQDADWTAVEVDEDFNGEFVNDKEEIMFSGLDKSENWAKVWGTQQGAQ